MAFLKFANAVLTRNLKSWDEWQGESLFHTKTAHQEIVSKYDPDKYLLSHCTIIASVDVEEEPNDHLIRPETVRWVNNNWDAWERELLLKSYKTFIGSNNYVEHVQVEQLSKGRVIDAISREVVFPAKTANEKEARSIYVDILVATDRKHKQLVKDIEEKRTDKLSMGCAVAYTICSKCGNKAEDTVQLCHHIKYEKGNKFIDEQGTERIIAELCGHKSDPESVQFVDASWVSSPAFLGAVLHSILQPDSSVQSKLKAAFEIQPLVGDESLHLKKVAGTEFFKVSAPEDELEEPPAEKPKKPPKEKPPTEKETPTEEIDLVPEEAIEEVETPDELSEISEEMSFSEVKDIIKTQLKERAKREIKEELLRELEKEFSQSDRSEEYFEDEGHTRDTLVSSATKEIDHPLFGKMQDTQPTNKLPLTQLGYVTAKTRKEAISKLTIVPRKKFADIYSKNFGSRKAAEEVHTAIKILNLTEKDAWLRLAKSKFSGKGAIILSAFLDSLTHANHNRNIYTAVLNLPKFNHKATFKAYLKRLFGRELETTELKKLATEIARFRLFTK